MCGEYFGPACDIGCDVSGDPAVELARQLRTCGCYDGATLVLVCHEDQPGSREVWERCRRCGGTGVPPEDVAIIRTALAAARAEERERCAEECERIAHWVSDQGDLAHPATYCAAAIRALT